MWPQCVSGEQQVVVVVVVVLVVLVVVTCLKGYILDEPGYFSACSILEGSEKTLENFENLSLVTEYFVSPKLLSCVNMMGQLIVSHDQFHLAVFWPFSSNFPTLKFFLLPFTKGEAQAPPQPTLKVKLILRD